MGTIGKDFKYKIIKNFLTSEEIHLLANYCRFRHINNLDSFDDCDPCYNTAYYCDELFESLLLSKKTIMEKETNLKLFPSYSYWRMYTNQSNLELHTDRDACEISVSVCVESDGTKWPLIVEGEEINLNNGEAITYLGRELLHGRNKFEGNFQSQCFLHYVNKEGNFSNLYLDKRAHPAQKRKVIYSD